VLKLLPPLTIGERELAYGLEVIADSVEVVLTAAPPVEEAPAEAVLAGEPS
jgi:hypothetical protein